MNPAGMTMTDVCAIADILAFSGRTVPADKWVTSIRDAEIAAENANNLVAVI